MSASSESAKPPRSIKIALHSWNVGNAEPAEDMRAWLGDAVNGGYDIVVIGVQECRFSKKKAILTPDSPKSKLTQKLSSSGAAVLSSPKSLHEKIHATVFWKIVDTHLTAYTSIASGRRLEMVLRVYALKDLASHISKVRVSNEATGIGGVVGNKGGIAISFRYSATTFCFLSAHFAAHQEKVEKRRQNYNEIVRNLRIGRKGFDLTNQFDYLFWMGDLNYRIDDLNFEEALALATAGTPEALAQLYKHDQLQKELDAHHIFHDFEAPVPSFPPTYRMKKGVYPREYNPDLGRIPSWCDRILLLNSPNPNLKASLHEFIAADSIVTSDHSPIRAVYSAPLRHAPPTGKDPSDYVLVLSNLRGEHLYAADSNGLSDPFIQFSSPGLLLKKQKTSVVPKTLNPIWRDRVILEFAPGTNEELLREGVIYAEVLDKDLSKTDKMGQFRLSLFEGFQALSQNVSFSVSVRHGGKEIGSVSGLIQIQRKEK